MTKNATPLLIGALLALALSACVVAPATGEAVAERPTQVTPTYTLVPSPTSTPTAVPTLTPSATPTETLRPTSTPTPSPTDTPDPCAYATTSAARRTYALSEIVRCLDTPDLVRRFTSANIRSQGEAQNEYVPAWTVYERGYDDGDGMAILQCYLLEENGWDAYMIGLGITMPNGRNVCGISLDDGTILVLDDGGEQLGPFSSLAAVYDHFGTGGTLLTIRASQIVAVTTDDTTPSVLGLPWVKHDPETGLSTTTDPCGDRLTPGARLRYSFDEILPCMNTPYRVSEFVRNNIEYQADTQNEYAPAWLVYERGVDDCDGQAILQCCFLEVNGWDAYMLGMGIELSSGHNVCAVNLADGRILALDTEGHQSGPYASLSGLYDWYRNRTGGTFRTIRASQITSPVTDDTSPSVLGLPWTIVEP